MELETSKHKSATPYSISSAENVWCVIT